MCSKRYFLNVVAITDMIIIDVMNRPRLHFKNFKKNIEFFITNTVILIKALSEEKDIKGLQFLIRGNVYMIIAFTYKMSHNTIVVMSK